MQGKSLEFSHFPLHSSCARKFGSPSCRNRNGFFANPIGGAFFKNHSYYSTSNRRNQLLFATFHSKIANLCNSPCFLPLFRHILFTSYNSLFFDGIPTKSTKIIRVFTILLQSSSEAQMCRQRPFSASRAGMGSVACATNGSRSCILQDSGGHHASFSLHDRHLAGHSPAGCRFTGFSAGILSARQSRPGAAPPGPSPPGR